MQVGILGHALVFRVDYYISAVKIIGVLSDQVPIYTVVQHWLSTTDRDHITIGLSLNPHPCSEKND